MKDEEISLEWLTFHWDKWRQEASRFWKHLAFATIALIALSMYQVGVIQFQFTSAKVVEHIDTTFIKKWLICPVSLWIWISIFFGLIDFLRHRVPEKYEPYIHNNEYPVPWLKHRLDLKAFARRLYLIVVLFYLAILGFWVVYCSVKVWK